VTSQVYGAIILGGGLAGAALAAALSPRVSLLILEHETHLGHHASGRSTCMFIPSYGGPIIAALAEASRPYFEAPPGGAASLLRPRDVLHISRRPNPAPSAKALPVSPAAIHTLSPMLKTQGLRSAWLETGTGELDAVGLHQSLIATAMRHGAGLRLGVQAQMLGHDGKIWRLRLEDEEHCCSALINATGAWADETAAALGLPALGLTAYRRTVVLVDPPEPRPQVLAGPIIKDLEDRFYFRPFGQDLLVCPCDETPSPPTDAQPETGDVALAVARLKQATGYEPQQIKHRWAGLRSFAPDRLPVIGWDLRAPDLFWFAGLGGYGVQTAPAAGRLAADLFLGTETPATRGIGGHNPQQFSPMRLAERILRATNV
jgi:D-arginine dehydrogenase|tara:strand:+ start:17329 stop:18450 length:1122 start_codon:yes stop_codon:yes gene_type:complete